MQVGWAACRKQRTRQSAHTMMTTEYVDSHYNVPRLINTEEFTTRYYNERSYVKHNTVHTSNLSGSVCARRARYSTYPRLLT